MISRHNSAPGPGDFPDEGGDRSTGLPRRGSVSNGWDVLSPETSTACGRGFAAAAWGAPLAAWPLSAGVAFPAYSDAVAIPSAAWSLSAGSAFPASFTALMFPLAAWQLSPSSTLHSSRPFCSSTLKRLSFSVATAVSAVAWLRGGRPAHIGFSQARQRTVLLHSPLSSSGVARVIQGVQAMPKSARYRNNCIHIDHAAAEVSMRRKVWDVGGAPSDGDLAGGRPRKQRSSGAGEPGPGRSPLANCA